MVLVIYLCNIVSCFIFFIRAKAFVRGTRSRRNLLLNGDRNQQFFGTFRNLSPSIISMERVTGTSDAAELDTIFWDIMVRIVQFTVSKSAFRIVVVLYWWCAPKIEC
jgi:hypothetical protein